MILLLFRHSLGNDKMSTKSYRHKKTKGISISRDGTPLVLPNVNKIILKSAFFEKVVFQRLK